MVDWLERDDLSECGRPGEMAMRLKEECSCLNGKAFYRPHARQFVPHLYADFRTDIEIPCPGCDGTGERPTAEARELMEMVRTQGVKP